MKQILNEEKNIKSSDSSKASAMFSLSAPLEREMVEEVQSPMEISHVQRVSLSIYDLKVLVKCSQFDVVQFKWERLTSHCSP